MIYAIFYFSLKTTIFKVELISPKKRKKRGEGGRPNDKCEERKEKKMRKERIRDGGMISCQISFTMVL